MSKYKVLEYFTWGQLSLDKNQYILVKDLGPNEIGNPRSTVSKEHYPEKQIQVSTPAVESMVLLKKIEKVS